MSRKTPKTYKLDPRLIKALESAALSEGESVGIYVQKILWLHCKQKGFIDEDLLESKRGRPRKY